MKISKALGLGLFFHVMLMVTLIIQPGCISTQPPTQTYSQSGSSRPSTLNNTEKSLTQSVLPESVLDSAFNEGLEVDTGKRQKPTRPESEFTEFNTVTPRLSPLGASSDASTVAVAGPSVKMHTVQKGESLWAISRRYNVSLNDLYTLNGLNKNSVLKIGQLIKIPVEGSTATIKTVTADTYQPSSFNMQTDTYIVERGDNLTKIARKFNTSVSLIKAANNKTSDTIRVGEKLTIPLKEGSRSSPPVAPRVAPKVVPAAASADVTDSKYALHSVQPGEYAAAIARKYGMTTRELLAINGITDSRKIQVGQKLKVNPVRSAASRTAANVSASPTTSSRAIPIQPETTATEDVPKIRVVEADPLVESEVEEFNPDELFEDVVEVPVIRVDSGE